MRHNLKTLINKLEEQGVLAKRHADVIRWLIKWLDNPVGRFVTWLLVKVIVDMVLHDIDDR